MFDVTSLKYDANGLIPAIARNLSSRTPSLRNLSRCGQGAAGDRIEFHVKGKMFVICSDDRNR